MLKGTYLWLTTDAQWINVVVWFKTINKLDFGLLMVHNWRLNCICFKMWSIWIKELVITDKGTLLSNEDSWCFLPLLVLSPLCLGLAVYNMWSATILVTIDVRASARLLYNAFRWGFSPPRWPFKKKRFLRRVSYQNCPIHILYMTHISFYVYIYVVYAFSSPTDQSKGQKHYFLPFFICHNAQNDGDH